MNFKSYNLFMAITEYIGEITAVKEGSKLPEMTVAMIEEFPDVP